MKKEIEPKITKEEKICYKPPDLIVGGCGLRGESDREGGPQDEPKPSRNSDTINGYSRHLDARIEWSRHKKT